MTDQLADLDDASTGERPASGTSGPASRRQRWRERRRNRVSRWDRPPQPRDWRFFVGTLGKVLIATGLLMFGFVAYQLWGTGIETARAQNRLQAGFEAALATTGDPDPPSPVVSLDPDPEPRVSDDPTDDVSTAVVTAPGTGTVDAPSGDTDDTEPDAPDASDEPPGDPPGDPDPSEVVPGGVDLSEQAVDQEIPPIIPGEAFARLEIPRIGKELYVVPGVSPSHLKEGPGHYPDTPLPGQLGNAAIAGHRTTYGAPFFDVDQLSPGDEMIVTMISGDQFVYRVTGVEVVGASDYWVVTTRDPNVAELTLTSCHPKYTARDRIVVHSVLVPERSARVGIAEFYDLDEPEADEPIEGDDPTLRAEDEPDVDAGTGTVATGTTPDTAGATDDVEEVDDAGGAAPEDTDAPDATVTAGGAATDEPPANAGDADDADDAGAPDATVTGGGASDEPPADAGSASAPGDVVTAPDRAATGTAAPPDDAEDLEEIDAFSQGWFEDDDAWPQIALWALALTAVALLAYQAAKRTRHTSVGILVGIAPFVLSLYFFYQNVNRLLPPGF